MKRASYGANYSLKHLGLSLLRLNISTNFRVFYNVQTLGWIFLLFVLILFPMIWAKPSPRLNRLVQLRDQARSLGVQVTLTPFKLKGGETIEGAAYRWLRPEGASLLPGYLCLMRKSLDEVRPIWTDWSDAWAIYQGDRALLTLEQQQELNSWLQSLPEGAFALEWGSATLAVWWDERDATPEKLEAWHAQVQRLWALPAKPFNRHELEKKPC